MPYAANRSSSPEAQIGSVLKKSSNYDGVNGRVAGDYSIDAAIPAAFDSPFSDAGVVFGDIDLDCEQPRDWKHPSCAMNDLNLLQGQMFQMEQEVNKQIVAKPELKKSGAFDNWQTFALGYHTWRDQIRLRIATKQANVDFLEGEVDDETEDATPERIEIGKKRDQYIDFRRRLAETGFKFAAGPKMEQVESTASSIGSLTNLVLAVGGLYVATKVFGLLSESKAR